jgi:uncharacterized membrane protein YqjE
MAESDTVGGGFRGLLQGVVANLAAIARSRLELFAIELQEEKQRLVQVLIWATAALFCGMMAFIMINVTLVYLFWESARLAVLISLSIFYTGALGAIAIGLKRYLERQPLPFSDTILEFQKDRECLRKKS